jgi:hypothetical protein
MYKELHMNYGYNTGFSETFHVNDERYTPDPVRSTTAQINVCTGDSEDAQCNVPPVNSTMNLQKL